MDVASFHQATFAYACGTHALHDISWTVASEQRWAILGDTGSGKTSLLEALAGRLRLVSGTRMLTGRCSLLGFCDRRLHAAYSAQRYEFADHEDPFTLRDYLGSAPPLFGLDILLDQAFVTLSSGQMRKARITRALHAKPDLLLLDDPFQGLDAGSRVELASILDAVKLPMVIACRLEDLPKSITYRLVLQRGRIVADAGAGLNAADGHIRLTSAIVAENDAKAIAELKDVTVRHNGKTILDSITWTVREGEHWAVLGPNGAGKTTLLSLLVGDHPQAFSNQVKLFGAQRGSGETLWDVRRRVGFVSPEFHLYFAADLTAAEAAETGFHDTLLHQPVTEEQAHAVRRLFEELGHADWMNQKMRRLSTGQQRIALLVRALVKQAPLVILDEPYQGFDAGQVQRLNDWLAKNLQKHQAFIVTTHRLEELPKSITKRLRLTDGRFDPMEA